MLAIAGLVLLSGCTAEVGDNPLALPAAQAAAEQARPAKPIYCYQTIGRVDCFEHPLPPSENHRLVSYYGPPPLARGGPSRP
ncbi:MAG: hypothetical protein OHK0024_16360 [Thalassobaculales bacterium]